VEIDAASNNGVNEIRDLREKVQYPPVNCRYKVYIIDEVHMLSPSAFNALLKTLEEPPKHAVFILATTEVHKMPATILSRCMRFDFKLVDVDTIASLIADIYDDLGKEYTIDAVNLIAKAGEGSVRDALSIADTCLSSASGKLTYKEVLTATGASDRGSILAFVTALVKGDAGEIFRLTDEVLKAGKSIGLMIKDVLSVLRELLVVKTAKTAKDISALWTIKPVSRILNSVKCFTVLICRCFFILSASGEEDAVSMKTSLLQVFFISRQIS
jgi:DNA polymerase-3 subunit gamma/tau